MAFICPAVELYGLEELPVRTPVLTPVNCVWFQVLKVSARNWNPRLSLILKSLYKDRFQLSRPGPFTMFLGELPHVSGAGWANALGLNHCLKVCG